MIRQAIQLWKTGEITWEMLVEVVRRIPVTPRPDIEPVDSIEAEWKRAEESDHTPGTWDDLYLEFLFHELDEDQFHELEVALLTPS